MKIRLGFVTNSSSTSYIIAYKTEELPEREKSFIDVFLNHISEDIIKNEDELKRFLTEYYGYNDFEEMIEEEGEWIRSKYEEYLNKIKEGYRIASLSVDYNNDELMDLIEDLEDKKNVIILDCE